MIKITCTIKGLDTLADDLLKEAEKKLGEELRRIGAKSVEIERVDTSLKAHTVELKRVSSDLRVSSLPKISAPGISRKKQ